MNYLQFQKTLKPYIIYSTKDVFKHFPKFSRRRLAEWQEKGYIDKIRNKYYCFSDDEKGLLFRLLTANEIYTPSYVSLESALSYYRIIPEGVFNITSISSLKTNNIQTFLGEFIYKNIKEELFFGYSLKPYKGRMILIADLEKTILDYLYLNSRIRSNLDFDGLRWNKIILNEELIAEKFENYLHLFNSKALNKRVNIFYNWNNM